jgi:ABC-2 type transport system permease protein
MISEAKIVFSEEFRRAIRRRGWLVVTAIVPIALIVAWILVPLLNRGEDKPPHPIGFVDLSGELVDVSVPDSLANRLPELVRFPSREAGLAALTSDTLEIEHVFVVAEGFLETGKVDWLSTKSGIFAGESNRNAFDGFLTVSLIADRLDPQLATRVLTPNVYTRINVGQDGTQSDEDEAAKFLLPVFLSMLLLISIMMGSSTLLQSVSEEKENRMIEVLLTSVSPLALMAGKVLAVGTTALIGVMVWAASIAVIGPRVFDVMPNAGELVVEPSTLVVVGAFFLAGYFLFAITFAGIGASVTSVREAGPITTLFAAPAVIPVYLSSVIVSDPAGTLARILSFIPFTAPTTMIQRVGSSDVSGIETLASLGVTLAAGVVMLFMSSRVFRAGLLLYGQRMTLRNILRAIRQAS